MTALQELRTKAGLQRLVQRETTTPAQMRNLLVVNPGLADYLLGRRRRGIHALGTLWQEYLL